MANDLVVGLALDYSQYQQGLQSSIAQNAAFSTSVKTMAAQAKAAQTALANANSLQTGSARMDRGLAVGRQQAVANLAGEQANNRVAAAQMNDAALAATRLATAIEQARGATIGLATGNQQLAASLKSTAAQGARLDQIYHQLVRTTLQDRQATMDASLARKALLRAWKEGTITSQEFTRAIKTANAAQANMAAGSGRTQVAIQQLIFAVDDASTIYGQQGLSGAIRAAANNMTTFASLMFGPWGLAIAVAVAAATQLYLALNKTGDSAKSAGEKLKEVTDAVKEQIDYMKKRVELEQDLKRAQKEGAGSEEIAKSVERRKNELELIEKEKQALVDRNDQLQGQSQLKGRSWGQFLSDPLNLTGNADASIQAGELAAQAAKEMEENGKRINELSKEQARLSGEVVRLEKEKLAIMEREKQTGAAMVQQGLQDFRRGFMEQAKMQRGEVEKAAKEYAQRAMDLKTAIADELDPTGKAKGRREIAMELKSRREAIDAMGGTNAERKALKDQAEQAALKKMKDLEGGQSNQGPSGFAKDSKEAMDAVRRAMLASSQPKDKSVQHLASIEQELKKLNDNEKEQRKLAEKMAKNAPTPMALP